MRKDFLSIIEAGYAQLPSEQAWLQGIANAALPCLDQGFGVNIYTYDASRAEDFRITSHAAAGDSPISAADITRFVKEGIAMYPAMLSLYYRPGPPGLFSRLARGMPARATADFGNVLLQSGVRDVLGVRAGDPSMRGLMITASGALPIPLSPRRIGLLAQVGAHLASAYRLRGQFDADGPDGVFDHDGRLLHARTAQVTARRALVAQFLRHRKVAHGGLRTESQDRAVEIWKALVNGEWTLIDSEERDGKRLVLLRANRPHVGDPGSLTLRQRQVVAYAAFGHSLKYIAYELGLASATVSRHLKDALRKLGMRSRHELLNDSGERSNQKAGLERPVRR